MTYDEYRELDILMWKFHRTKKQEEKTKMLLDKFEALSKDEQEALMHERHLEEAAILRQKGTT